MEIKKKVLATYADNEGSGTYRIKEPYTNIKSDKIDFILGGERLEFAYASQFDAILTQRPIDPKLRDFLSSFQQKGGIVVMETDDHYSGTPHYNPTYNYWREHRVVNSQIAALSDYIHCSTPELRLLVGYPSKTIVFSNAIKGSNPNYIEAIVRRETLRNKYNIPLDKKVIMWGGSTSHTDTIEILAPIIKHYSLRNDIIFVIASGREWLQQNRIQEDFNVKIIDWLPVDEYKALPSIADIFLTPLNDSEFNSAKSELKCIESAVWGVPCVSSATAPYIRFNELSGGGNLLVKKNRFRDWVGQIDRLLNNPQLQINIAQKAVEAVRTTYSLDTVNKQRVEWWESILQIG